MVHLGHINPVIVPVRTDPLDPYDALLEIDSYDQTICIALYVEYDTVGRHDARGGI
jgi:hypothetical protein